MQNDDEASAAAKKEAKTSVASEGDVKAGVTSDTVTGVTSKDDAVTGVASKDDVTMEKEAKTSVPTRDGVTASVTVVDDSQTDKDVSKPMQNSADNDKTESLAAGVTSPNVDTNDERTDDAAMSVDNVTSMELAQRSFGNVLKEDNME